MADTLASPMPAQDAVANGVSSPASILGVDPILIVEHLASVVMITLGAKREDLERDGNLLSPALHSDTVHRCNRFATDAQVALYIQKEMVPVPDDIADGPGDSGMAFVDPQMNRENAYHSTTVPPSYTYTIASEISSAPTIVAYLALLKRPQAIDPSLPLFSQIQIQTLPGAASLSNVATEQGPSTSPFEILHTILHNALAPYFDASTKSSQAVNGTRTRADVDAKTGIPVTKKRMTELELSLLHLQQNVEIPDLSLAFHPIVQSALDDAAAKNVKPTIDLISSQLLSDSKFMNNLQSTVNSWIKAIQSITKLTKDPMTRTATQEINFWLSMESALEGIEAQLRSEGVTLTLEILKHAKRFQATVSFTSDTGLKEAMEMVQKHNQLMRDFPLDELLSATSLTKVDDAIIQIFGHINKKMRFSNYPIKRTLTLVERISADLKEVMHRLLPGAELVDLEYKDFKAIMDTANRIFERWDSQLKEFTNVARETTRRRQEKFIPIKIAPKHSDLQARLKYIDTFRDNHEQLQRTIVIVLGAKTPVNGFYSEVVTNGGASLVNDNSDMDAVEEVQQAWAALKNVDLLDVSEEGTQRWVKAENTYNERTTRVENSIIATLRDRLATAKNANEMFRVFSQFNALFVRPKIRGAIAEYQQQLIENVKQAISALHERFKQQYGNSEAHAMAQLHDLPPVSGFIIWARQIERQLDGYMKKVEDILGSDWTMHSEGQKLQAESELFRKKLNAAAIYKTWIEDVQRKQITISGRLFNINKIRSANNALDLAVNFDAQIITLFKETRNLGWQNFNVPHSVHTVAKDAKRVYPFAVSLMESVRTFTQTTRQISEMSDVSMLLSGYQNEVHNLIAKGVPLKWETFIDTWELHQKPAMATGGALEHPAASRQNAGSKHVLFVREFAVAASKLQAKTIALAATDVTIEKALKELATCPYEASEFQSRLQIVQGAVDELNLQQYSNLGFWVEKMNERIKETLLNRLKNAIIAWVKAFEVEESPNHNSTFRRKELAPSGEPLKSDAPSIKATELEITMRNQVIYLDPPLESARANWFLQFHEWLGIVCNLPKIKASRYQMSLALSAAVAEEARFTDLPSECTEILLQVYTSIEKKLSSIGDYVDKWLQFQSLWDLQSEQVYDTLGDELPRWLQLLQEIRKSRTTFDTSEISRFFGHLEIKYEQVQSKVNAKYDQWQQEILAKFGSRLGVRMREVHAGIEKARRDLEMQTLEANSTAQAVQFITLVQSCQRNVNAWAPEVETFRQGQSTLQRNRYQLPNDWLDVQQVDSQWDALNELLSRKAKIMQDQTDALKAKIVAEDKVVKDKIAEISTEWNEEKPASGSIAPEVASQTLRNFESRITKLQEELEMVSKAREALDLHTDTDSPLSNIMDEVQDFKAVWASLSTVWAGLSELRETLWTGVKPTKVRLALDGLIKMTKDMPTRLRQYAAFEHIQETLRLLLKSHNLLNDLKSDAIRDRHWEKIWKETTRRRYSPVSMTLGDVWDLKRLISEPTLKKIIDQARGEKNLEDELKKVKDKWNSYSLELGTYKKTTVKIIKEWDDLFTNCGDDLTSLQLMKKSPYYKEFQEDASAWEDKLTRIQNLFDVWIEVQRQWTYLDGIFASSADLKHMLPEDSHRFGLLNKDFTGLMKKVAAKPDVLDVLTISGIQKTLERIGEQLKKIQKALKSFLEKERISFPRFYFLGDEDLLEMIGNSQESETIAKHFKKMFAGLNGLVMSDSDIKIITGFSSREGETVSLKKEISLARFPKINDWLTHLENGMKSTLAELLAEAVEQYTQLFESSKMEQTALNTFMESYPTQIVVLATQVVWTTAVEKSLSEGGRNLQSLFDREVEVLRFIAGTVLGELEKIQRSKCEALITECVHQRDVIERLIKAKANSPLHYLWLLQMRYVYVSEGEFLERLHIKMANAKLNYGFEYLGAPDRLVRTPLTDRCFGTLTQGLCQKLGGSPYGPAGTGKTESVKALGVQLGRFTLVFCCDDTFDFQAMERIFLGITQVGAWGCFDEFNRLEERILSAVSQMIQDIQLGLKQGADDTNKLTALMGRDVRVNENTGIFITMNPGYAGRSNLPDNLKKLFRSVAMSKPDKELIAEVMLFSQGFNQAKELSKQIVPFFDQCSAKLSKQPHYDFGLRALKSVLVSSGGLKRARLTGPGDDAGSGNVSEPEIIVQSIRETIAPKLVSTDVDIMLTVQADSFAGVQYVPANLAELEKTIRELAANENLVVTDTWITKVLQLYQIQNIHHGVMVVGNSGTGKTKAWKLLFEALSQVEDMDGAKAESVSHVIDAKVMSKEALYGNLDPSTREWTDGLFTSTLRKILDNVQKKPLKRHWIVFDCDVDPEWVENLNSVLDDNKLLTLPNGERLALPDNVRIMFEVETLKYATLATVSRCGMVWFSEDTVTPDMMVTNYLGNLRNVPLPDLEEATDDMALPIQAQVADLLSTYLTNGNFIFNTLEEAEDFNHIMEFTVARALTSLFSLLNRTVRDLIGHNATHLDFPLSPEEIDGYVTKKLLLAVVWAFTGDCPLDDRKAFGQKVASLATFVSSPLDGTNSLIDFDVPKDSLPAAQWTPWQNKVKRDDLQPQDITKPNKVIETLDTLRHEDVLYSCLAEHKPLLLCGPPGSGKTMTLMSALRNLENMVYAGLNFSSATTPELVIKTLEQHCEYKKTQKGMVLAPTQDSQWLVLFCDEINLPAPDKYGTQTAIAFLRQLMEQNGFWRIAKGDKVWVRFDRIQFVGACNPPTDAGRTPLGARFLRHAPLIMVDYPGEVSLVQIYGTFIAAVTKLVPTLRQYAEPLTNAMVRFYLESQQRFTAKIQPHYIYSPRELTRWTRGIYEAMFGRADSDDYPVTLNGLVRIWAHEALRLFRDRLVSEEERIWTDEKVAAIATQCFGDFPDFNTTEALGAPILFSYWLKNICIPVDREELRHHVKRRLEEFKEEESNLELVPHDDVLEHASRIDRVFKQPQGHLILIGVSGSGKTTLAKFVAWMNGMKVFQMTTHRNYTGKDFDDDLRKVLKKCACNDEKTCFIMDESNVLESGFLERMNTLLANAEIPGLFEGDDLTALMNACKEAQDQKSSAVLDSEEEIFKWFTGRIIKNLHVVFTMNPPEEGLSSRAATSPALFNRCVLNWMGDWSDQAFVQVASKKTTSIDLDVANFQAPDTIPFIYPGINSPPSHRETVINSMVHIHYSLQHVNVKLRKQQGKITFLSPRHFLDFIEQFEKLYNEKRNNLEEQQRHLNVGLDKLKSTEQEVSELRKSLNVKQAQLKAADAEARVKQEIALKQNEVASRRGEQAQKLKEELIAKRKSIDERRVIVEQRLAEVEPAVEQAKQSVGEISSQALAELKKGFQSTTPQESQMPTVYMIEAILALLKDVADPSMGDVTDRKTQRGAINDTAAFKERLIMFDTKSLSKKARDFVRATYIPEDFATVTFPSMKEKAKFMKERTNTAATRKHIWKAAVAANSAANKGLAIWLAAQIDYAEILDQVAPLHEEIQELTVEEAETDKQYKLAEENAREAKELSTKSSEEATALNQEIGRTQQELDVVMNKVTKSEKLLGSLGSEKARWIEGTKSFESQMGTLIGDVLVAAALLAYGGLYDQTFRRLMMEDWLRQLSLSGVRIKTPNPVTNYLSTADERFKWQSNSLPVDDLCTENAIILKRFNRFPLVIDPSGRIVDFLQKEYKDITLTSFSNKAFRKVLGNCLRYGRPILIQDAEHLDPIVNQILNKEIQKDGFITFDNEKILWQAGFKLYLFTRDPSATFPPDVCSRTTLVNFTVTKNSLQIQTLNDVLKSERPEDEKKRSELIMAQGQLAVERQEAEKSLLDVLNESQGNILEDRKVIETLQTLQEKAQEISDKLSNHEETMSQFNKITQEYDIVARSCSAIFTILEQLHYINHFYRFSLQYFLDIFHSVLTSDNLKKYKDDNKKDGNDERFFNDCRNIIMKDLFITTFKRTALGLLQRDRVTLALLLAQASPFQIDKGLIGIILDEQIEDKDLSTDQDAKDDALVKAKKLSVLEGKLDKVPADAWDKFLSEEIAENFVPQIWDADTEPHSQALLSLLLVKLFRLDRFVPAAERFAVSVFGSGLFDLVEDLGHIVDQVPLTRPISLVSSPGFDASYKVDNLVERLSKKCTSIAMGSNESLVSADKAIKGAAEGGRWVLIKNVHLTLDWLQWLEKEMVDLKPRDGFRLFLSMESSPKIPVNLLRASRVLMYEQPAGVRANMLDSMASLSTRATKSPVERARVYLLLSFLHAVVQERLRYAPELGWKGFWEFNDADYECSAFIVDTWIESVAKNRTNIAPQNIPWDMICYLVRETYGGKIDDQGDFQCLTDLVNSILQPAAFDDGHKLVEGNKEEGLEVPSGTGLQEFMGWVRNLPEREPPTYLGLPANAEKLLLVSLGRSVMGDLRRVRELLDEDEELMQQ